jgi:hypothetical protein
MNPRAQCYTRDSLRETLLSSLDRSKGSQRAPYGGESLVVHVDGYHSILNAYDASREADSYHSILNAYNAGREAIWIYLGFLPATTRAYRAHRQLLDTGYREKV